MNFRDVGLNSCKASGSINERQELSVKGSSFQIDDHPDLRRRRNKLFESLNPFPRYRKFEGPKSAHVAAWLPQAGDEALADRIGNICKYNRSRPSCVLERYCGWCCAGKEHIWVQLNQLHCRGLQLTRRRTSPTVVERNI